MAELNEAYIAKMEKVLEVYERPYDARQPVVCLDEKPVTLHADVRPASPAMPGQEARRDNEYERRGSGAFQLGDSPDVVGVVRRAVLD
ncbi:MAG: hypothetical protein ACUVXB_18125, partial [Bryobacteraceae bacterium]